MLDKGIDNRRLRQYVILTYSSVTTDAFGHASMGEPSVVLRVPASVSQMSASKVMATFQQADAVGLDITFRKPTDNVEWNGLTFEGHDVHFSKPDIDQRGRWITIQGWYQVDNPAY